MRTDLSETPGCPYCGAANRPGSPYCGACGAGLTASVRRNPARRWSSQQQPLAGATMALIAFRVLSFLVPLILIVLFWTGKWGGFRAGSAVGWVRLDEGVGYEGGPQAVITRASNPSDVGRRFDLEHSVGETLRERLESEQSRLDTQNTIRLPFTGHPNGSDAPGNAVERRGLLPASLRRPIARQGRAHGHERGVPAPACGLRRDPATRPRAAG